MTDTAESSWCDSGSDWSATGAAFDLHSLINAEFLRFIATSRGRRKRPTQRRDEAPSTHYKRPGLRQRLEELLQMDARGTGVPSALLDGLVSAIRQQTDHVHAGALVVHHLSDPENSTLRQAVLDGSLPPTVLASMRETELVNPNVREKWEKQRLAALQQKTVLFVEQLTSVVTSIYTCPACGGQECILRRRQADKQKWAGDDATPNLLTCCACSHAFWR
ncbi:transcription elongation factor [Trypanosoma rangeli SC58]|uniref:Transcription elongation factor n=1 Tax=Trypanosoma rangeli SC58 TaxID=429131 RepID=A0A061J1G8_TRYRA|nr:transcription elongation factor [Trypanosoma rangeli SC58]